MEFEKLEDIIGKTLIGKKLKYINSKQYKDATILSVNNITYLESERYGGQARIELDIEQPFKSSTRKRIVSFLNDDSIVIE